MMHDATLDVWRNQHHAEGFLLILHLWVLASQPAEHRLAPGRWIGNVVAGSEHKQPVPDSNRSRAAAQQQQPPMTWHPPPTTTAGGDMNTTAGGDIS
jgi:hypothetical protein